MATIDSSYVEREVKAIIAVSNRLKHLVKDAFERMEDDPSQFDVLEEVPEWIVDNAPNATFRKVYLEHNPHNFRLVLIHWKVSDRPDHVDVIYAFPRQKGYKIDWDWVDKILSEGP